MVPTARDTDRAVRFGLGVLALYSLLAVGVYGDGLAWRGQVVAASLLLFAASMFVTVGMGRRTHALPERTRRFSRE